MARVDIRPFVLGWLKDVRNATAPDGGWRTLDEIRAGLQRQGIQASASECRKVLAALMGEGVLSRRVGRAKDPTVWRFVTHEEHEDAIEQKAAHNLADDHPDVHRYSGTAPGMVEVRLSFLVELCAEGTGVREGLLEAIQKARASARGLIQKSPDAPKDGGS